MHEDSQSSDPATFPGLSGLAGLTGDDDDPETAAMMQRVEAQLFEETYEPVRVGRFAMLKMVGSGAMGVVYLGYDDVLDRRVALKLIQRERVHGEEADARLLREAQAMARVSHANVVHVYEAGRYPGGVFVAMEYVDGQTLRGWLAEDRTWQEKLEMLVRAGRGLAAAHREGVVHRDFKPDNVLVTALGEPKVADFGLAGVGEVARDAELAVSGLDRLTQTGGVVGTPRYMSPEQFEARTVTPRSDQFAFCVVAFEALYSVQPFAGSSVMELMEAVVGGEVQSIPAATLVPAQIGAAILRGLSSDPDERWPSMEALLQNLTPAPKRRRRLVALGAIGVLGAAALAWVGMRPTPCRGAAEHLRGVWDQARREAMAASFEAVGTPFARNVWARESPRVDAYARSWAEMHTRACEMTRVTGEQSEAVLDLRMACLQQARMELVAALDVMQTPDDDALEHAHEIVGGLPELARCADGPRLQAVFDPPAPAEEAAVGAIREQIARSRALVRGGKFDEGLAEAQGARDALGMIEYGPVRTEVLLAIGGAQVKRQDDDAAAAAFREAHASATEHGQWENAVEAAGLLAFSLGARGSRFAEAHVAIDLGIGLARRIDDPETIARFHSHRASVLSTEADYEAAVAAFEASLAAWDDPDGQRAETHRSLGITYLRWGKFDEAEAEIRRALELRIEKLGSEHPDVAMTYHTLGNVLREQGQLDEAGAAYEEAIAIADATMPGHPETALLRQSKGAILVAQGKPDEAEQLYRTILAEWEPKLGAEHTTIAAVRNNLAGMLLARGETNGALELLRAVLDGRARTMGEEHPSTLSARGNVAAALLYGGRPAEAELELRRAIEGTQKVLGPQSASLAGLQDDLGTALADQGRYAEAEPAYRAAIAILEREFSRDHIELGGPMNNLGTVLFAAEKYEEAGKAFEDALRIFEGSLAPNHPNVAMALVNVGNVARARREWDHAIPPLERAVNIYESGPAPPSDRGEARYRLGAGLWESGRDRKRAARLLAAARVDFAAAPEEIGRKAVAELDAYLREQRIEIEVLVETATEATR